MADFRFKTGKTLFSDGLDCKAYLEEYFNVQFDERNLSETPTGSEKGGGKWNH